MVPRILPVLPVRDVVVFPGVTIPLTIGRQRSVAALEEADRDGFLLVVTQLDAATEDPTPVDLYSTGTVVKVLRAVEAQRAGRQALVVGIARAKLGQVCASDP
ncbi:MAG: LON peptidase substrate-binding domain-containing protein, partial [Myxococcota bacterium]